MTCETVSGKCPNCSYDKMIMRYGSSGWTQWEACPRCGFACMDGQNWQEENEYPIWHEYVWKELCRMYRELGSTREEFFLWAEEIERFNDIEETLFIYNDRHLQDFREKKLPVYELDSKRADILEKKKQFIKVLKEAGIDEVFGDSENEYPFFLALREMTSRRINISFGKYEQDAFTNSSSSDDSKPF